MGQRHGKAAFLRATTPFVNASEKDVNKLWETFNDVAEGFGLNQDEMSEICRALQPTLEIHAKAEMDQLTVALFVALDTDENGLVDALEFLGTIAVMSAMTIAQKLTFVYNCYDFNETGQISIDELTLALKSTLTGLCKLAAGVVCPSELVLEDIALHAFHKAQKHSPDAFLTLSEFLKFAETTPEMTSWIDFFDSPDELVEENDRDDSDLELESHVIMPVDSDIETARKRDLSFPFDLKAPSFAQDAPIPPQPWQIVVANAAPSAPPAIDPSLPAASLDLDWVYGFNSDFRSVVKYVSAAEIVYPAGSVVVLYDVIEHKQRFALHHSDKVQTLAVHPTNRNIIASGERGLMPKVVVWSAQGALDSTLSVLRGFHKNGVRHVAWMPNGRTLVTVGQDDFHCVAVYQWETKAGGSAGGGAAVEWSKPATLIFADRCGREPVHACIVTSNSHFVTCGQRHLFFWSRESDDRYTSEHALFFKRRGVLGRKTKVQTLVSLASLPNDSNFVLAGTARGQILLFEGRNCIRVLHAHASAVNVLQAFPGGILSAGKDGKVRLWSKRMEPGAQFDMEALGSVSSRVRSLSASPDGGAKLLIATSGAEIYEIATSDGSNLHFGAMLCGHFAFELHGLAVHPLKREFCTTGDDRTVRIWDMNSHRQARMAMLEAPSQTCAYSPDGSLLAVGQGAPDDGTSLTSKQQQKRINANKQGAFAVLSENVLAVKYETKDSKRFIRNVKFSGDGLTLAVGSSDNCIYAYNTEDWASKGKCKARDAAAVLSHVDFSATGEYIMASATNKREMVFFESSSGVEITRIATLRDVEWLTWTCPYGWWVQGVWPSLERFAYEVCAVDRSSSNSQAASASQLLVAGDNFGTLRLYRYPCVDANALCQVAHGPSSGISAVRFSADSRMVVACATEERCVFQWRVEYEEEDASGDNASAAEYEYHPTSDDELEMGHGGERSAFDEAAAVGDFALELLHQHNLGELKDDGGAGSASVPTKPWVSSSIPPADAPDETDLELSAVPDENLELEWVYGFRCHDARNNLFLTRVKAHVVFPAANVVVVQDTKLWLQRHFKQHTDEVTSLAVHFGVKSGKKRPNTSSTAASSQDERPSSSTDTSTSTGNTLEIVASGQMGKYPAIHIWRVDTLEVLMSLRGFHHRGIAEMRFNAQGNLLASVGLDDSNSLAVYDWQSGVLLARASTNGVGRILGICFQQEMPQKAVEDSAAGAPSGAADATSSVLLTVGVKHVSFWRLSGQNLVKKSAILGKKGLVQSFLSVVFCGKDAIVGTTSGDLYRFKGIELVSIVPAHTRSVAALHCVPKVPHQIVSGGKDGVVKLWSSDLECLGEFSEFNTFKHAIRSVFWDFERNQLLVGTAGASIHQLSSLDGSVVTPRTPDGTDVTSVESHFRKELHGLSVCASKERFCTTGDDAFLRVWDLLRHVQVLAKELETSSRACAYSYDGDFIAVGLGSGGTGKRHKKDGSLLVFEERTLSVELVYETRDTKQSISVIKYSPDGQSLVVGSLDNAIYIYDVPSNYTKRAVFSKHKSFITHVDISSDSQYIRSNCGGFELLFADITTGSHVASATALRNQKWETCATVYNWFNQGVWPASAAASAVQITTSAASLPGTSADIGSAVVVAGTSHGALNLFKFPCFVKGAGCKTYFGHSGEVAHVEFSLKNGGAHCISIGRMDRCVLQWRKTRAKGSSDADETLGGSVGNATVLKDPEEDVDITTEGLFLPESFINIPQEEIKPFLSAIIPPSSATSEPSTEDGVAAKTAFELEHIFGLRAHDVRNNVVYAKTKHVLYHTGCVGIHYDRRTHSQQFYRGHTRPIVSLAASRDGSFIATGEICSENLQQERPRIHIWEPTSCSRVTVLSEFHFKAVSYLGFSSSGKLLASVGQDEHHSLAVYSSASGLWFDGALLATTKTTRHEVFFVAFIDDPASSYQVVSGGKDHVVFWKIDAPSLVGTYGVFGAKAQLQPILCGASIGNLVVTGCSTGHLYVWESCVVSRAIPAHNGAVYAIHATKDGYATGGRDGHVKLWSKTVTPLADFDVNDVKPAVQNAFVRSVCWDPAEDRVLIGTKGGEVLELSRLTGETSVVTESHFDHCGLYGLSAHPQRPELVATVGEDQTVRVWDLNRRQVVTKVTLDGALRCVAYSPDGKWLAAGFGGGDGSSVGSPNKSGAFVVMDALTLEVLHEGRDCKQSIAELKFSPDLTLLALGSNDHCVYFYSTLDNFSLRFKFPKASGRVTHLDFAVDSRALRLTSESWELLFVSTLDGSQVTTPSSMKDVAWATHSCVFAWPVQGIWDFARDDEYFHALAKAHSMELLVSGNNRGDVRVYNVPCLSKRTEQHVLRGHSMNVSGVAFTCDDARLVTIGANDKSLFVWKVC